MKIITNNKVLKSIFKKIRILKDFFCLDVFPKNRLFLCFGNFGTMLGSYPLDPKI